MGARLFALVGAACTSLSCVTPSPAQVERRPTIAAHPSLPLPEQVGSPEALPAEVGEGGANLGTSSAFNAIEGLVEQAIVEHKLPGCVVTIGRHDSILFQRAFGRRQLLPSELPMQEDTVFDLASLTKPIATAMSILILAERKQLDLDAPLARYVQEFATADKKEITVRQLLVHTSGLPRETPIDDYGQGLSEAIRRIAAAPRKAAAGSVFAYSDVGYVVLAEVVRRVGGLSLDRFVEQAVFEPLGMRETGFLPEGPLRSRAAATEQRDGGWEVGDVHDPRAYRLGGVAGHAGLFSTAADLSRFAQAILERGVLEGHRVLRAESVRAMLAPHDVPGGIRALGWDMQSAYSSNKGTLLSRRAVGHGGYTGTALWIDPERDLFIVFLSNRVHPDGKGAVNPLVAQIADVAVRAVEPADVRVGSITTTDTARTVLNGVDVLQASGFELLRGAQVGLLTHDAGRALDGTRTSELLRRAPEVTLRALFAPEHGLASNRDEKIEDTVTPAGSIPIYSLYGATFQPTAHMLEGIDTLVVDLQDVGVRFFTYASTLHQVLRVGAREGLRVVVLDRPNPLGGTEVSGPVLGKAALSFVNHHPLPILHGLTLGELAELVVADEHLPVDLRVIRMQGYRRTLTYDETGLRWVAPSPNLPSLTAAVLYPAVALVEGTNVSVGRGTDHPFEWVGAPFVDGEKLSAALSAQALPGVAFAPVSFVPKSSRHAGESCRGVRLSVTDRATFLPVRTGMALAQALYRLYPTVYQIDKMRDIIGSALVSQGIEQGLPLLDIESLWAADLRAFRQKREKYLLYGE